MTKPKISNSRKNKILDEKRIIGLRTLKIRMTPLQKNTQKKKGKEFNDRHDDDNPTCHCEHCQDVNLPCLYRTLDYLCK